jgi:hypothetical protein
MNEIVCVPEWFLLVLFMAGFALGYWGDIFLREDKGKGGAK